MSEANDADDGISSMTTIEDVQEVLKVTEVVLNFLARKIAWVEVLVMYEPHGLEDVLVQVEMAKLCVGYPVVNPVNVESFKNHLEVAKKVLLEDLAEFRRQMEIARDKAGQRQRELTP